MGLTCLITEYAGVELYPKHPDLPQPGGIEDEFGNDLRVANVVVVRRLSSRSMVDRRSCPAYYTPRSERQEG